MITIYTIKTIYILSRVRGSMSDIIEILQSDTVVDNYYYKLRVSGKQCPGIKAVI
jgi:hypothetical protein